MEEQQTIIVIAGSTIIAIVAVAIIWSVIRRRRRALAMQTPIPLIPFASNHVSIGRPSRPDMTPRQGSTAISPDDAVNPWAPPAGSERPGFGGLMPSSSPATGAGPVAPSGRVPGSALTDTAVAADEVAGAAVDGASVRFWRPADGTLQFLPGRLEVVAGRDAGQEIRFVRTPGPDGTQVTFGRAEGPPYRHVQLREPTVSRAHARMTLESVASPGSASGHGSVQPGASSGARWRLENLSATNPVVVNGRPLGANGESSSAVTLSEGDRIEMGEVVFLFHER